MKKMYLRKWFFSVIILCCILPGHAQIPKTPTVQLLVTDNSGKAVADGSYDITVSLYDALTGGNTVWTETQSAMISGGLVNLILGQTTPLNVAFDMPYFVGIKIGNDNELSPRLPLNPSTYSLAARAVYGSSNIFPDDGDVGIGTLTPMAKLDIEGKLRIADVPEIDTLSTVLVRDINDDKIVKSMPLDTFLHVLNKASWKFAWWGWPGPMGPMGPQGPKGPPGPPGSTGNPGDDLVVLDSLGNVVFRVYAKDGKSIHYGHEFFKDSLTVGDTTKNHFVVFPDGSFGLVDKNGKIITGVQSDGTSDHKGTEYFQGGVIIGNPDSSTYVSISDNGRIQIYNKDSTITAFNPDGTSLHTGLEYFKGGIAVGDSTKNHFIADPDGTFGLVGKDGVLITGVRPDGTSDHFGAEYFQKGIQIGHPDSTTAVEISTDGSIRIFNKDSTITAWRADGTSYHSGLEYFKGGISVGDSTKNHFVADPDGGFGLVNKDGTIITGVAPDGTSDHFGEEWFQGGITVGNTDSAGFVRISPGGKITMKDNLGNIKAEFNPDGTSTHYGMETYKTGITVGNGDSTYFKIFPNGKYGIFQKDGTALTEFTADGKSYHNGWEYFNKGITVGIPGGDTYFGVQGDGHFGIYGKDGTPITVFGNDGTSTHTGKETFSGGLEIPLLAEPGASGAGKIVISPDPSVGIEIFDANGNPVQHMRPDGQAYHALGLTVGGTISAQNLQVTGEKNFKIDDPLDPENKYLLHRSIESDERLNLYNGNIVLGKKGRATVTLPKWFGAINEDFRYQLTAIGAPGPHLYISKEIKNNKFTIAGGKKGMKVSWQVTGIRKDAYAKAHPALVEVPKKKNGVLAEDTK